MGAWGEGVKAARNSRTQPSSSALSPPLEVRAWASGSLPGGPVSHLTGQQGASCQQGSVGLGQGQGLDVPAHQQ